MPLPVSARDLKHLQRTHHDYLMDSCKILVHSSTSQDSTGAMVDTYTESTLTYACGLHNKSGTEVHSQNQNLEVIEAILRLSYLDGGGSIQAKDRIKLTKQAGITLDTSVVYEVVGAIRRGIAGIQMDVVRVVPSSLG